MNKKKVEFRNYRKIEMLSGASGTAVQEVRRIRIQPPPQSLAKPNRFDLR